MNLGKSVYWHQGLFLQPQHLQCMELTQQRLAHAIISSEKSYPWGFSQIHVNKSALASGMFECSSFAVLMRDGSFINYPQNCQIMPRSFESAWSDKLKPLDVFLALVRESGIESNVTVVSDDSGFSHVSTRYITSIQGESQRDRYQGGNEVAIRQLDYNLKYCFGREIEGVEDAEFIHIARLVQENGETHLDSRFVPPVICIGASTAILTIIDDLKNNLQGRAAMLKSFEGTIGLESSANSDVVARNRSALQVMANATALLISFLESKSEEPVYVYRVMRSLVAQLSLYSANYNIVGESSTSELPSLRAYEHDSLSMVFGNAVSVISHLLNELTVGPELMVNLDNAESGKYVGSLGQEFFNHKNTVYLVLRSELKLNDWISRFRDFSKLGAAGQVEVYARRSLPGINVMQIEGKPLGVKGHPDAVYFAIERQGHEWGYVEDTGQVCLIWDDAPEDLVVDMLALKG